jgi:bifunctional DNA-binding transcriptional regulator/antitoxin component of YhaV-PrlF toxin-antitoxin module
MGLKSAVAKANSKSPSIRTTIPEKIAAELSLRPGDVLDWELASENNRRIVKVKKLE